MESIILYNDKDIKYETVNFESEYIIYSSINHIKILGFINFKLTSEKECIVKEIIVYPNFKNKLFQILEDYNSIDTISKILLKKAEKIAKQNGVQYMIIDEKYIKITKPLSLIYFYIFLSIIIGLKIVNFLF